MYMCVHICLKYIGNEDYFNLIKRFDPHPKRTNSKNSNSEVVNS